MIQAQRFFAALMPNKREAVKAGLGFLTLAADFHMPNVFTSALLIEFLV